MPFDPGTLTAFLHVANPGATARWVLETTVADASGRLAYGSSPELTVITGRQTFADLSLPAGRLLFARLRLVSNFMGAAPVFASLQYQSGPGVSAQPGPVIAAGWAEADASHLTTAVDGILPPLLPPPALTYVQAEPSPGSDPEPVAFVANLQGVLYIEATLTTSAVAGTRSPYLEITDAIHASLWSPATATVAASTVTRFVWAPYPVAPVAGSGRVWSPLPSTTLPANTGLQIVTAGLQSGDQWDEIRWVLRP